MEKTAEKVIVRVYKDSDKEFFVRACEGIQEYVSSLDTQNRIIVNPEYGEFFTNKLFTKVAENEGLILMAEDGDKVVGTGLAFICKPKPEDALRHVPELVGEIRNLYVDAGSRSKGIGRALLGALEKYLKAKGCNVVQLYVFEPNQKAHKLYKKLGYCDRTIEMQKEL